MKVLVACEFSGVVRRAFRNLGHDAWSCDLLDSEDDSEFHYKCDVLSLPLEKFDLMIAHPPCTYLTVSGNRWYANQPELIQEGVDFALALFNSPVKKIALENPVGRLSSYWRKPDQYIQPWMFGHGETKKTGLWLKNLPKLEPTNIVEGREPRVHKMGPGKDRWKERSRTYEGIAEAMAKQWGRHCQKVDKEQRRRNYEAKRLYEERRFRRRTEKTKVEKQKQRRLRMKDILDYEYNEELPSDV